MLTYDPHDFWRIAFARGGSGIPKIMSRVIVMMPFSVGIAALDHFELLDHGAYSFSTVTMPFTVMLGLLMSLRNADAFRKWQRADNLILELHQASRAAVGKMCAYLPKSPEAEEAIHEMRRLLVLACLFIKVPRA